MANIDEQQVEAVARSLYLDATEHTRVGKWFNFFVWEELSEGQREAWRQKALGTA